MTKQKTLNFLIIMLVFFATVLGCCSLISSMPKAEAAANPVQYFKGVVNTNPGGFFSNYENTKITLPFVPNAFYFVSFNASCENLFPLSNLVCTYNDYNNPVAFTYQPSTYIKNYTFSFVLSNQQGVPDLYLNVAYNYLLDVMEDKPFDLRISDVDIYYQVGGSISSIFNYFYSESYGIGYSDGYVDCKEEYKNDYQNGYSDGYDDGSAVGQGKNLFNVSENPIYVAGGSKVTYTNTNNKLVVSNLSTVDTAPYVIYALPLTVGNIYTFSCNYNRTVNAGTLIAIRSINFSNVYSNIVFLRPSADIGSLNFSFTVPADSVFIRFNFYSSGWIGAAGSCEFSDIQIELGSSSTSYAPFVSSIDDLVTETYDNGYSVGKADGKAEQAPISYVEGYTAGEADGKAEQAPISYSEGYTAGEADGKAEQAPISYSEGYIQGNRDSSDNYDIGYSAGYDVGMSDGLATADEFTGTGLGLVGGIISATFRSGIRTLDTVGKQSFFGMPVWSIFIVLICIPIFGVIIALIKKFILK